MNSEKIATWEETLKIFRDTKLQSIIIFNIKILFKHLASHINYMYNMMQVIIMRTTINIPDDVVREAESLYNTTTRSKAIENALKDAIRFKKLQLFMQLKSKIHFDEEAIRNLREKEIDET